MCAPPPEFGEVFSQKSDLELFLEGPGQLWKRDSSLLLCGGQANTGSSVSVLGGIFNEAEFFFLLLAYEGHA